MQDNGARVMVMKVFLIIARPGKGGNTDLLTGELQKRMWQETMRMIRYLKYTTYFSFLRVLHKFP